MKKKFLAALLGCLIAGAVFTPPLWSGQVVTDDVKTWAKEAIKNEKALKSAKAL